MSTRARRTGSDTDTATYSSDWARRGEIKERGAPQRSQSLNSTTHRKPSSPISGARSFSPFDRSEKSLLTFSKEKAAIEKLEHVHKSEVPTLPTIGKLKLQLGPRVSTNTLGKLQEQRRRASQTVFREWVEEKTRLQAEQEALAEQEHSVGAKQLRVRRRASLVAYANWCADKDEEQLAATRQQEALWRQQAAEENRERRAQYLRELALHRAQQAAIREECTNDVREHLSQLAKLGGERLNSPSLKLSERARCEMFSGVMDLQADIDAVVRDRPDCPDRPERPGQ
jgi:hypothetical protein